MSRLLSDGQPESTRDYKFVAEKWLEMYDVEEIPNGTSPLKFTTIDHY